MTRTASDPKGDPTTTWDDILLTKHPDEAALHRALALVFGVSQRQVQLVHSSHSDSGSALVRGVLTKKRGDFNCMLSVSIAEGVVDADRVGGVRQICVALSATAFVPDEAPDPCSGVLIDALGSLQRALLDPKAENSGEDRLRRRTP